MKTRLDSTLFALTQLVLIVGSPKDAVKIIARAMELRFQLFLREMIEYKPKRGLNKPKRDTNHPFVRYTSYRKSIHSRLLKNPETLKMLGKEIREQTKKAYDSKFDSLPAARRLRAAYRLQMLWEACPHV